MQAEKDRQVIVRQDSYVGQSERSGITGGTDIRQTRHVGGVRVGRQVR